MVKIQRAKEVVVGALEAYVVDDVYSFWWLVGLECVVETKM